MLKPKNVEIVMKKIKMLTLSLCISASYNALSYDSTRAAFESQKSSFESYAKACNKAWQENLKKRGQYNKGGYIAKGAAAYSPNRELSRKTFQGTKRDNQGRLLKFCKLKNEFEMYHPGTSY